METFNQVRTHVVNQPTLFSLRSSIKHILGAATLTAAVVAPAWSAQLPDVAAVQSAAHPADPEAAE
jgi:hypothetical protein